MPLAPYCINFQVQTIEKSRSVFRPGFYHSFSWHEPVATNSPVLLRFREQDSFIYKAKKSTRSHCQRRKARFLLAMLR